MTSSRCVFTAWQTSLWLTFHLLFRLCILNGCRTSLTVWEEKCKWMNPYQSSPVTPSCLFSQNSELKSCNDAKLQDRKRSSAWGAMPRDPSHTGNATNSYLNANSNSIPVKSTLPVRWKPPVGLRRNTTSQKASFTVYISYNNNIYCKHQMPAGIFKALTSFWEAIQFAWAA